VKVLTVVGARPQFVKAGVVSRALRPDHEEVLVHTGQHYDEELSAVFFDDLDIPEPDHNLGAGSGSHGEQIAAMLPDLESLIESAAPDVVLTYGDTNSTLAAALLAARMDPTLAHVEAGLRSDNWDIPEESNRVLTDHASTLLFAPTVTAVQNLAAEGLTAGVHRTGDVMYDAMLWARDRAAEHSSVQDRLDLPAGEYTLATVHRAGNTDDPERLAGIVEGLGRAPGEVVLPLHPRTESRLREYDLYADLDAAVRIVDPQGYLDFVALLDGATRVVTDSGGVQKEAFFLDTPCVTMREETEWVETVESDWNVLVGADPAAIAGARREATAPAAKPNPFGDGDAAERIVEVLDHA
jgi:UDP-GlcNAc3NAcA epimerase